MVVLITRVFAFPSKQNFIKALKEKHPEITTIIQNVNERKTNVILGNKEYVLYEDGKHAEDLFLEDEINFLKICYDWLNG